MYPGFKGSGAAVVGLFLQGSTAHLVHLGDSRAYLQRGGRLMRLTLDQTFARWLVDTGAATDQATQLEPRCVTGYASTWLERVSHAIRKLQNTFAPLPELQFGGAVCASVVGTGHSSFTKLSSAMLASLRVIEIYPPTTLHVLLTTLHIPLINSSW